MKIRKLPLLHLRNNEHFQCQTEFKALVEEFNAETLNIDQLFNNNYLPAYAALDEAMTKIIKNSFTDKRGSCDYQRDKTFRGLINTLNAGRNHFDPDVRDAARRLKIVFDRFGNVAQLPLNEETSAIYNLVQEVTENHAANAAKLNIITWLNQLKADNEAYEALVTGGYEEEAAKTELKVKQTRLKIDKALRQIIEHIDALITIDGETGYTEFVRRINLQFSKYANILAQRKGIATAKKK